MVTDRLLVLVRDAQQHPDDPHRHLGTEVRDEVEAPGTDQRVEAPGGEVADLRLQRSHALRGEDPRQQRPMAGVHRGVLEDERPGRLLRVGLDELEDVAAPRDERVPVDERPLEVFVPASAKKP